MADPAGKQRERGKHEMKKRKNERQALKIFRWFVTTLFLAVLLTPQNADRKWLTADRPVCQG